jgi:hypothetical protein
MSTSQKISAHCADLNPSKNIVTIAIPPDILILASKKS